MYPRSQLQFGIVIVLQIIRDLGIGVPQYNAERLSLKLCLKFSNLNVPNSPTSQDSQLLHVSVSSTFGYYHKLPIGEAGMILTQLISSIFSTDRKKPWQKTSITSYG